jgi:hypothetical protein
MEGVWRELLLILLQKSEAVHINSMDESRQPEARLFPLSSPLAIAYQSKRPGFRPAFSILSTSRV